MRSLAHLHHFAVLMDDRAKVLGYRMTSQCASGSGQFLENICRYLGITIDEIGPLSLQADNPEEKTRDMGGTATTLNFADALIRKLR